jgi:perosamine synthetase
MKIKQMILTAGPKRSKNEIRYVTDAVKNGWNFHHSDYIKRFEKAFASYLGVKYALAMPTGTSALHLALHLFGVGPGDEVIIPDMTYIACANAVHYLGATPVLVDIDADSWSIDVSKVEKHISKRTKAIMPVHLYGNVADMEGITKIARKYNLFVLEDACQGLGCRLYGRKIGTLGDAAAFSFQGAKLLSIGEGGMYTTNRKDWYMKALSLADHGVSFVKQLWANKIGYMYPMSNVQAALGLARLEDIEANILRKQRIYSWYKEGLSDISGLALNPERKGAVSSFWMSSVLIPQESRISRDEVRKKLEEKLIDTRPFFYPISRFGIYKGPKEKNETSYNVSQRGINLPSGVMLTKEKVLYVVSTLRKILSV